MSQGRVGIALPRAFMVPHDVKMLKAARQEARSSPHTHYHPFSVDLHCFRILHRHTSLTLFPCTDNGDFLRRRFIHSIVWLECVVPADAPYLISRSRPHSI